MPRSAGACPTATVIGGEESERGAARGVGQGRLQFRGLVRRLPLPQHDYDSVGLVEACDEPEPRPIGRTAHHGRLDPDGWTVIGAEHPY